MKILLFVTIVMCLVSCASKEQLPPQQKDVTTISVEVKATDEHEGSERIISDEEKIAEIISFINARSEGWKEPFSDSLEGDVYLAFYRDARFVGNYYVGNDFFGRDYGSPWVQDATQLEVSKFLTIVGADLTKINVSDRCSAAELSTLNQLIMANRLAKFSLENNAFKELSLHYPNWCETENGGAKYKIYTAGQSRNKLIIEKVEDGDKRSYFGPVRLSN
jgi:hypothetical protein